ncbi:MAG: glycosyltransferase family 4 protein, partial [candidate division Zixibacteria bacterium]|nr:glycosyltransferase family 4 protein [candidate division Zixibacteria bacterium]
AVNKERLVVTVGGVDWERTRRKGYEVFVKSAAHLPDVKFVLVGKWYDSSIDYLRKIAPGNVTFTGSVSQEELVKLLGRAKVYVQASFHEAFGCSLAEAMLCECIPVVSRNGAIPEVVGDTGIYLDELTPQELAKKIEIALKLPDEYGKRARKRIIECFPLIKRKNAILELIQGMN